MGSIATRIFGHDFGAGRVKVECVSGLATIIANDEIDSQPVQSL